LNKFVGDQILVRCTKTIGFSNRIPGRRSFEEANATDCTVFINDPTFVAEDLVDQLLEKETDETKSRMPPIRVVASKMNLERFQRGLILGSRQLKPSPFRRNGGRLVEADEASFGVKGLHC